MANKKIIASVIVALFAAAAFGGIAYAAVQNSSVSNNGNDVNVKDITIDIYNAAGTSSVSTNVFSNAEVTRYCDIVTDDQGKTKKYGFDTGAQDNSVEMTNAQGRPVLKITGDGLTASDLFDVTVSISKGVGGHLHHEVVTKFSVSLQAANEDAISHDFTVKNDDTVDAYTFENIKAATAYTITIKIFFTTSELVIEDANLDDMSTIDKIGFKFLETEAEE